MQGASGPRKKKYDVKIGVTDMYISGLVSALAKAPRPKKQTKNQRAVVA